MTKQVEELTRGEALARVAVLEAEVADHKRLQAEAERLQAEAARARIVELEDVAREALAVIERLRPDRAGMGTIVRLKAALAQQGKEGEA